jgi:hypothetical protein
MIQLFGQSVALDGSPAEEIASLPARRRTAGLGHALEARWRLALECAAVFAVLAMAYFLDEALVQKAWPAYRAESIVSVQPAGRNLPDGGALPGEPSGGDADETSLQREMASVSGQDVLASALHRLTGFRRAGESEQAAAQRLGRALEVTRLGPAYQFSIRARAETPAMAAQIANAAAAASVETAKRDEQTGKAQQQQMWREERDRVQSTLFADLAEQSALNKQSGVAAGGADVARLERLSELGAEIARLKGRAAAVDEQWLDLALTDGAAGATYQVTAAVAPTGRSKSGVLRNSALIGAAGLIFGVLAVAGFVVSRAGLKEDEGLLRASEEAIEQHPAAEGSNAAEDAEGNNPVPADLPSGEGLLNSLFSAGLVPLPVPLTTPAADAEAPAAAKDWEPARMWTARRASADPASQPVEVDFSAELKRLMASGKQFSNPWTGLKETGVQGPGLQGTGVQEAPRAEAKLAPRRERAPEPGREAEAGDQSARLDALRSLLLAMVAKNGSGGNGTTEHQDR